MQTNLVQGEQEICTAPQGKLRLVHVDARDHTPTRYGDYASEAAVKETLRGMLHGQALEMRVYNDQGKEVRID